MQPATIHSFPSSFETPLAGHAAMAPLLDLALTEANAQGAYLYIVDLRNASARLAVWSGLSPAAANVSLELQGSVVHSQFSRSTPLVAHERAWESVIFKELPEFRSNRFEGTVSVPLLEGGHVAGLFNVCRTHRVALKPREFSFLLSLSIPIQALLLASAVRDNLEREVEKLTRQLADRKLFERAKGLIQSRFDWTEEQAYFCLRNLSRRRRTPMRQIAEHIIATAATGISVEEGRYEA